MIWKKIILLAITYIHAPGLLAQAAVSAGQRFTLTGRVPSHLKELILSYLDQSGHFISDTCFLLKDSFNFSGHISGPVMANLSVAGTTPGAGGGADFTLLFLEPTQMDLTMADGDLKHAIISGSMTQQELSALEVKKIPLHKKMDKITRELSSLNEQLQNSDNAALLNDLRDKILDRYLECRGQEEQEDLDFIRSHPGSCLSAYLLAYWLGCKDIPLNIAAALFGALSANCRESSYGQTVAEQIANRKKSATGSIAPLFFRTDANGQTVALTSPPSKTCVLLYFWASWSAPSRKIIPNLQALFERFLPDELKIIGIALDRDKKKWEEAIVQDHTDNWSQLYGEIFQGAEDALPEIYGAGKLPLLVLINQNGLISGRYGGDGEDGDDKALGEMLHHLLKAPPSPAEAIKKK